MHRCSIKQLAKIRHHTIYIPRQVSHYTTNHLVILSNVSDTYFETLLAPNQEDQPDIPTTHCCGKLKADVTNDSSDFGCKMIYIAAPSTYVIWTEKILPNSVTFETKENYFSMN